MTPSIPALLVLLAAAPAATDVTATAGRVRRGEYLVGIMSCNDCHTPSRLDAEHAALVPDLTRTLAGDPQGVTDSTAKPMKGDVMVVGPNFTSFTLPFGTVRAANLTPDPETGLGKWTEQMFVDAMRKGRSTGTGRAIMPPMPWYNVAVATDEDLRSIFAYLQTLKPVKNLVEVPSVPAEVETKIRASNDELARKLAGRVAGTGASGSERGAPAR